MTDVHRKSSVRFRFIDWLHSRVDQFLQNVLKALGRSQVHTQSALNVDGGNVGCVNNNCAQGYTYDTGIYPVLCDEINEQYVGVIISNVPVNASHVYDLAAARNYIIHQQIPHETVEYLRIMNARKAGVES